jgi:hypothetical protein
MSMKLMGAAFAGLTMIASLGGAAPAPAASAAQQYGPYYPGVYCSGQTCWPIIYQHDVYTDESMTTWIGGGTDTCSESMGMVFRNEPWLPTGYEVKTPLYLCAPGGPYEIPG